MIHRGLALALFLTARLLSSSFVVAEDSDNDNFVAPAPSFPPAPSIPSPTIGPTFSGNPVSVTVVLTADTAPEEIGWLLFETVGGMLNNHVSFGTYKTAGATESVTLSLTEGTLYTLQLQDSGNNGICCSNGNGNVVVYLGEVPNEDNILAVSHGAYASQEFLTFEASSGGTIVVMPSAAPSGPTEAPSPSPSNTFMPTTTSAPTVMDNTIPVVLTIAVLTDRFPGEIFWELYDSERNPVATFGNYTRSSTLELQTVVAALDEEYALILTDFADDGICCRHGNGEARVYLGFPDASPLAYTDGNYGASDFLTFLASPEGIIDVPPPAPTFAPDAAPVLAPPSIFAPFDFGSRPSSGVSFAPVVGSPTVGRPSFVRPSFFGLTSNDECVDAVEVFPGDPSFFGSTLEASVDTEIEDCSGEPLTAPGVWFSVRGTGSTMTASLCFQLGISNGGYNSKVSVFEGECGENLCLGAGDNACGDGQGFATWFADFGVEYKILVHGSGVSAGTFALTIGVESLACNVCGPGGTMGNPDGDFEFPGAPMLRCAIMQELGDLGAIPSDICQFLPGLVSDTCGCSGASPVASPAIGGSPFFFSPPPVAPAFRPFNDVCEDAELVEVPGSVFGTTVSSSVDEVGEQCGTSVDTGGGVWYTVIGTGESMRASTCDQATSYDTKLTVFEGSCSRLRCLSGNDDACGLSSVVQWSPREGAEYKILVHGYGPTTGDFSLNVGLSSSPIAFSSPIVTPVFAPSLRTSCSVCGEGQVIGAPDEVFGGIPGFPPLTCQLWQDLGVFGFWETELCDLIRQQIVDACLCQPSSPAFTPVPVSTQAPVFVAPVAPVDNDVCAEARAAAIGLQRGTTIGASIDDSGDCGEATISSPGVWYSFVGTGESVTASTCVGTSFDSKLSIYGGTCRALDCVDGNDDACGSQSSVSWVATSGEEYFILVHGFGGSIGDFNLTITQGETAPAFTPTLSPVLVPSNSTNITFVPPNSANSTTEPAATLDPPVSPPVSEEALAESEEIVNDDQPAATQSSDVCQNANRVDLGFQVGTTKGASIDTEVDRCGPAITSPGVWYEIFGTGTEMRADTCNDMTDFDTKISLYSGMDCSILTCISGNDDAVSCGAARSSVSWDSTSNMSYKLLVHGFGGASGAFGLNITTAN